MVSGNYTRGWREEKGQPKLFGCLLKVALFLRQFRLCRAQMMTTRDLRAGTVISIGGVAGMVIVGMLMFICGIAGI